MVIEEALRLYPPTWQLMRRAIGEDEIGGYRIKAGTTLFWSQYLLHRHAAFWQDPERFDPERFAPDQVALHHRYAHMPFGTGPRMCIGASFAMTEILLILATIAQRYRLLPASQQAVEPLATLALRPRHGVPVRLARR
jgi:cytochrome P450